MDQDFCNSAHGRGTDATSKGQSRALDSTQGVSPGTGCTIGSRSSSMGRKKATNQRPAKSRRKFKQKQPGRHFHDTNNIYPPNQAYQKAAQDLQSPTKRRPQSGGPSPDKNKIRVDETEQVSEQLQKVQPQDQYKRIFTDHKETQILLTRAKAGLQQTRKQIKQSIVQSQNTLDYYKDYINEYKKNVENKINEQLK